MRTRDHRLICYIMLLTRVMILCEGYLHSRSAFTCNSFVRNASRSLAPQICCTRKVKKGIFSSARHYSAKDTIDEYEKIVKMLEDYDRAYYQFDSPKVSDAEYDCLRLRLANLKNKNPNLFSSDTSLSRVGASLEWKTLQPIKHLRPCLSLENAFTSEDVLNFLRRIEKEAFGASLSRGEEHDELSFVAEPKIDGLSCLLLYRNGKLERAATRGDGIVGEDVTASIFSLNGLPHIIKSAAPLLEVRGEVYISTKQFSALNEERLKAGDIPFVSPRNAAAGTVRSLDQRTVASRGLAFFAYDIALPDAEKNATLDIINIFSQVQLLEQLHQWGFEVSAHNTYISSSETASLAEKLFEYHAHLERERENIPFEIDGAVYKVDNLLLRNSLGTSSRAPRWAIAHKFGAQEGITTLNGITFQVGRTGILTPVALLDPLILGGVTISRATLFNADELDQLQLRPGDRVLIRRAGDVIPTIISKVGSIASEGVPVLRMPSECPSCGGKVVRKDSYSGTFCPSGAKCEGQVLSRICHFTSKEAMNIRGLGQASLNSLIKNGIIRTPLDLYNLTGNDEGGLTKSESGERQSTLEKICDLPGWGPKKLKLLIDSIDKSRTVSLNRFIYALGIPQVGAQTAKQLSDFYHGDFKLFWNEICEGNHNDETRKTFITSVAETRKLGRVMAESLVNFTKISENKKFIEELSKKLIFVSPVHQKQPKGISPISENLDLKDKRITFTGTLESMTRMQAKNLATDLGAVPTSTLSKTNDFIVLGKNPAISKLQRAQELGIKVILESEWLLLCNKF